MITLKQLQRFLSDSCGVAAIEFALLFPFFFLLFWGLIDLAGYITAARKATNAASVVADLVAQDSATTTKATLTDYAASLGMIFYERNKDVQVKVENYYWDTATSTYMKRWSWDNSAVAPSAPACSSKKPPDTMLATLTGSGTNRNDVIATRVCMTYKPNFKMIFKTTFSIEEASVVRPRTSSTLLCTDC